MGFSSFMCAKSNESIPVSCVERCEVTLFLRNGKKISGEFDGYGNIGEHNEIIQQVLFDTEGFDIKYLGGKEEPEGHGSSNSIYTLIVDVKDNHGTTHAMEHSIRISPGKDPKELFDANRNWILKDLAFDINKNSLKIVKNKYLESTDTFESLSCSPSCPYQGYWYPEDYDWGTPHQFQGQDDGEFENDDLTTNSDRPQASNAPGL